MKEKTISEGQSFHFPPYCIHQEEAITDCLIIEVSTPHLNDRIRVEKHFNLEEEPGLPSTNYGDIVENGNTSKIFKNPLHPYTKLLVEVSPTKNKKIQSDDFGELPNMIKPPNGCLFYARCRRRNEICN